MKFRLLELMFVLAVIGVVAAYFHQKPSAPVHAPMNEPGPISRSTTAPSPPTNAPKALALGEAVPSFSLSDPSNQSWTYTAGQGPILLVLTATGCSGCLERIDNVDREAYQLAKSKKVPVWNMLVFQDVNGASEFVEQRKPSQDLVLCDPTSDVSVKTLGGSDDTCWLLIDRQGRLAWRGPAEMEGLRAGLRSL